MSFEPRILGRSGLQVGPIGLAASYGCPAECVERAFDLGVNYFYWGSMRRGPFAQGLLNLGDRRDRYHLVIQSYSRIAALIPWSIERALRKLRTDYADVLLLGLWNKAVPERIVNAWLEVKERGLVRHLAVSTHQRTAVPQTLSAQPLDIIHVRYNAVHTGAERDIFPHVPAQGAPGLVAFTATSWKQLLNPKNVPPGERTPTAEDCYRFALSNSAISVCMAGPASAGEFEAVPRALAAGPMNNDELAWMRRVGAVIYKTKGKRQLRD